MTHRPFSRILCEAVVIALIVVIIGAITTCVWARLFPEKHKGEPHYLWPMVGSLFITGFLAHFCREYTGVNRFVCGKIQGESATPA